MTKQVVLAGGGMPHLHCLRALAGRPLAGARLTVVAPTEQVVYSGMLPGWIAGHYALRECCIPLASLAAAAGATFMAASVARVDAPRRTLRCDDGREVAFDVLSIAVGSAIDDERLQGARNPGIAVRPLERFTSNWSKARDRLAENGGDLVVVGEGAGGIEIALAAAHAFSTRPDVRITIATTRDARPEPSRRRLDRLIARAGIVVHSGAAAVRVDDRAVTLATDERLCADAVIVATGSAAPPWLRASDLIVDDAGYALVAPTLQVVSGAPIFVAGDAASIVLQPQPRSGVHALRMGSTLLENLRRSVAGHALVTHVPRERALRLISAGDRYAVGAWGRLAFEGRWVWRWKDRIDRAFVAGLTPGLTR